MANSKKVKVDVHIVRDSTKPPSQQPYKFWLNPNDSKIGKKKDDKLTFDSEHIYKGFEIDFDLKDETGENFYFMDIGTDANGDPGIRTSLRCG